MALASQTGRQKRSRTFQHVDTHVQAVAGMGLSDIQRAVFLPQVQVRGDELLELETRP